MSDPTAQDCITTYHATRHSGTRSLSQITLIVMHDTEGGTAESNAKYFASVGAKGSSHLVVDDNHCYRCLANEQIPWAGPPCNVNGFHIEQAGYAAWTTAQWTKHLPMLHRGAYKTAFHCHKFHIPPIFLEAKDIPRRSGVTTHAEVSKAYPKIDDHTDPGYGWPRTLFMTLVAHYFSELGT